MFILNVPLKTTIQYESNAKESPTYTITLLPDNSYEVALKNSQGQVVGEINFIFETCRLLDDICISGKLII